MTYTTTDFTYTFRATRNRALTLAERAKAPVIRELADRVCRYFDNEPAAAAVDMADVDAAVFGLGLLGVASDLLVQQERDELTYKMDPDLRRRAVARINGTPE